MENFQEGSGSDRYAPSLVVSKARLNGAVGNFGRWCPCPWHGVGTRWPSRFLSTQTFLRFCGAMKCAAKVGIRLPREPDARYQYKHIFVFLSNLSQCVRWKISLGLI